MKVRILENLVGPSLDYRAGSVQNLGTAAGNDLVGAGLAILEGPSPSGSIGTYFSNAGYTRLVPYASGYVGPSGFIPDAPGNGGFYCTDDYTVTVVWPGKVETTFDILRMRPKLT